MTRIIEKHRCIEGPDPTTISGRVLIVHDRKGKLIGCADPFPGGRPVNRWRQEKLIKEAAKQIIEIAKN